MQLVAMTDFHFGLREAAEIIHRGDTFTPLGTGAMNAREQAQSLIRVGSCCAPEDWPKLRDRTEANYAWAKAEVARLNAENAAREARRAAAHP